MCSPLVPPYEERRKQRELVRALIEVIRNDKPTATVYDYSAIKSRLRVIEGGRRDGIPEGDSPSDTNPQ